MLTNNNKDLQLVLQGIKRAAGIITSTMGGSGKNVLLYEGGHLTFTKDGVSVADKLGFVEPQENAGAQLLINAANKTVKECGDGTTLTCLLTKELIENSLNNQQDVNEFIEQGDLVVNDLVAYLKSTSKRIENATDIYNIALTSCKDARLAEMIKNLYVRVGLDGKVEVEQARHSSTTLIEYTEGYSFEEGYINSNFANQDNGNCVLENVQMVVEDGFINEVQELAGFIKENVDTKKESLLLLAKGFSEMVIRFALNNKAQGLNICLVKLPGYGEGYKENIKDIKAFLNNYKANKVVVTPYKFTIFNNPNKSNIRRRVKTLQAHLSNATEEWEVKDYEQRIANLQQKSAIIYVGGRTDKAAKEEFDRIEDAVGAVKSSAIHGYHPGAGVVFYNYANENLPSWFVKTLQSPALTILKNANINTYPSEKPYNTKTKQIDENLIDPTLVLISALENAWSLTKLLINTSYIVYD